MCIRDRGPDVHFAAVFFLLDDFGRHPVRGADHGGAFGALFGEFGAEAEISDFDVAAGGEEDVIGFDVAVNDVLGVQMDEAFACLWGLLACVSVVVVLHRL